MKLVPIGREEKAVAILYALLGERTAEQSISHKGMPSWDEHEAFVRSNPYQAWYLLQEGDEYVGSVYLSKQREIGIFIFERYARRGYGRQGVELLMQRWPGRFLANINPANGRSIEFFQKLGFRHIQNTYAIDTNQMRVVGEVGQ